jgi:hypothetical protein
MAAWTADSTITIASGDARATRPDSHGARVVAMNPASNGPDSHGVRM